MSRFSLYYVVRGTWCSKKKIVKLWASDPGCGYIKIEIGMVKRMMNLGPEQ